MSRNKLSALDRNQIFNNKIYDMLMRRNEHEINNFILKIRSKALRDLCVFWLNSLSDTYVFYLKNPPLQIGKNLNISERKTYDLIKVGCFLSNLMDVAFNCMSNPGLDKGRQEAKEWMNYKIKA